MTRVEDERTPAIKLLFAILIAAALAIPIFMVWLLVYDRQMQSEQATASIAEGWGAAQRISGPVLVIPYRATATETVVQNGQSVTRTNQIIRELTLSPELVELSTAISPELRKRSIYEAVVFQASLRGKARFSLPPDLARTGVDPSQLELTRAELRFGVSDPQGLEGNPRVTMNGQPLRLEPGGGIGAPGFFAWVDAASLTANPLAVDFAYVVRGNQEVSLLPQAGNTHWQVASSWPNPSFGGMFLPSSRHVTKTGFTADYRIGNLALGRSLVTTSDAAPTKRPDSVDSVAIEPAIAGISLIRPVDLYSQVDRATKYGFLFVGFTFLALLMFDVIGGVRVSPVEYLLMGAALILFFVLLLAFAEVIGFTLAYVLAAAAIVGLNTAYAAAVLGSWRRGWFIGGLLVGLYTVLYILLSLEAYSLLIGSLLLFVALAGVMYATRSIDWSGRTGDAEA